MSIVPRDRRHATARAHRNAWLRSAAAMLLSLAAAAGLASAAELRLPPDHVYERGLKPDSAVVFRHDRHVRFQSGRCTGCHPKLFRLLSQTPPFTHREMNAGAACGACHEGTHAFDLRATASCGSCHAGRQAARPANDADSTTFHGPQPIVYAAGSASPGAVTFRHDRHLQDGTRCAACHPTSFAMTAHRGAAAAELRAHSSCGTCHDGSRAFDTRDPRACGRCHVRGRTGP